MFLHLIGTLDHKWHEIYFYKNTAQQAFRGPEILTNIIQSAKNVKTTDFFTYTLQIFFSI